MIEKLRVRILAGAAGEFSSPLPGLILCADSYLVSIPFCVTVVACKGPWSIGHSARSAGGRLHLNSRTPVTQ